MIGRNPTIDDRKALDDPASRFSPSYFARRMVRTRLSNLKDGLLVVEDPWGRWQTGEPSAAPVTLRVTDAGTYLAFVTGGSLGAARAYMDGHWSCSDLTGLLRLFIRNISVLDGAESGFATIANAVARFSHAMRANTRTGSRRNIHEHYDLGNDLFSLFLDETMTYSAGIFEHTSSSLRDASIAKLDRICRKLDLGPGDHVLEIGSGWGSFAMHAAQRYGCRVTTTTISSEQFELAAERIARAGIGDRVEILLEDYRNLTGCYDKLVSIEMVEAVGDEFLAG